MRMIKLFLVSFFVLFASAALADPPPGVGPSVLVDDGGGCSVGYFDGDVWVPIYAGTAKWRYSNGATGHMTFKCKMDLQEGQDPITLYWEFPDSPLLGCYSTISLEDNKGTWTAQCFGYWQE